MIKIYFDDILINEDAYAGIENEYKLFDKTFHLGSVSANVFKIKVAKEYVSALPSVVKIEDDNTEFILNVDTVEEDKGFYSMTLTDKMVNFNFNYDASVLINEDEGDTHLQDIFENICVQAGIETDYVLDNVNNIVVDWWDSSVQARQYISYIAEIEGGFAYINEYDKLDIKEHNVASSKTISSDEVSELILGERKFVSRVVYDNAIGTHWVREVQDEEEEAVEGITVYLNADNPFLIDEAQVDLVFDRIKEFEFWTLKVPNSQIDTNVRAGDIITFTHLGNDYKTIAQYNASYGGGWVGSYELDLDTERQVETQIIGEKDRIKAIRTIVDRVENTLDIVVEETDTNTSNIANLSLSVQGIESKVGEVDDLNERVNVVEQTASDITARIEKIGGQNLIVNSVGLYNQDDWENPHDVVLETNPNYNDLYNNSVSKSGWMFMENRIHKQVIDVPQGTYTMSAKYKKLLAPATIHFIVNGLPYEVAETDWTEIEYTFTTSSNSIEISFVTDSDNSLIMTDLMLNGEEIALTWQPANGESILGIVRMSSAGVDVGSKSGSNVNLGKDGLRMYYQNTEVGRTIASGIFAREIKADKGDIAQLLIIEKDNQTWLSRR